MDNSMKAWCVNNADYEPMFKMYGHDYESVMSKLYASHVNEGWDAVLIPYQLPEYCALVGYNPSSESFDQAQVIALVDGNRQRHHGEFAHYWQSTHPGYLIWWENLDRREVRILREKGIIK